MSDQVALSKTVNTLAKKTIIQDGQTQTLYPYIGSSTVERHDLAGNTYDMGTVITENTFDDYGNLTLQKTSTSGDGKTFGSEVTTIYSSATPTWVASWLISLPTKVTQKKTNADLVSLTRTVDYEYDINTGLRTKATTEKGTAALSVVTDYGYVGNKFGLVSSKKESWKDPLSLTTKSRTSSRTFDSKGRFPSVVTNAAGHTETSTYDGATGVRISLKDVNELTTTWTADNFGRVRSELRPDGNETRFGLPKKCVGECRGDAALVQIVEYFHGSSRSAVPMLTYSDEVGHVLSQQSWGYKGDAVYTDQTYDDMGRLKARYQPAFGTASTTYISSRLEYDILNRVIHSYALDEANKEQLSQSDYNGLTVTLTNPLTYMRIDKRNVIGQIEQVTDALKGVTKFAYDSFGNLSKTTDPRNNIITVEYDLLGRKTKLSDPDLGVVQYTPDPLGRVVAQST
ncbi:RHS repeat domain-containing protein, partial [Duganella sp. S19_KUP01_CR8]|uniref:RHS repeat domain-containing protein n=1 Tax=Duganella sp. S19_KUP01_CR8 TaxID=3025502 RepID=UPI002FCDD356